MMKSQMMILKILMRSESDDNSDGDDEKNDFNNFGKSR